MTDATDPLQEARDAYVRRDWVTARAGFAAAREQAPLDADDQFALASCAWWLGDLDVAMPAQEAAYRLYVAAGQPEAAALAAVEAGYTRMIRGEEARASGWMRRAVRLLEGRPDCVEQGYLAYVDFETAFHGGSLDSAMEAARRVHALGERFHDPTLTALGVLGQGRVLVRSGRVRDGMALLDEAMVAAVSDELSDPSWTGNIYCHLMVACYEIGDLARAGEWTEATARWCETLPGAGPFMGICRVHRAQLLNVRGVWDQAERDVVRVCDELAHFDVDIVAEAYYELGELRRQRGDVTGAEAAFRDAHRLGRDPQPGLALVRLAGGRAEAAAASIRSALAAAEGDPVKRARLLPAAVEIAVASGDLAQAREASDELAEVAGTYGSTGLAARSRHAQGAVLLAAGEPGQALPALREALERWRELGAPYEAARVRLRLADAYRSLGDSDAAAREQQVAADEFDRLGARMPGVAPSERRPVLPAGLTAREVEVLGLVATGRSNQQIAAELVLSVRTVERHLATIYRKLGLQGRSARAAAVTFAHREGVLTPS